MLVDTDLRHQIQYFVGDLWSDPFGNLDWFLQKAGFARVAGFGLRVF